MQLTEPNGPTRPSDQLAEASPDAEGSSTTTRLAPPSPRRLWTGRTTSWILSVIAVGGWLLAWSVHRGLVKAFPAEDFGTITFMVASAAFLLLALIKVPQWQVAGLSGTDLERFDAENEARKTIAQIIGGVGLVAGLYFTSLQVRETQRATTNNEVQTREGQITDRYIRAVQQLGSSEPQSLSIRMGAIFALERIARESKTDYWPIIELLSAYVRNRSGPPLAGSQLQVLTGFKELMPFVGIDALGQAVMPKTNKPYLVLRSTVPPDNSHDIEEAWPDESAPEDVQAAMTVLGRRRLDYEDGPWRPLNLRFVNLSGLNLESAHLEGADLEGANLRNVNFTGACLCGAHLRKTLMNEVTLNRADLRRADLTGAILLNNRTHGADVREAIIDAVEAPGHEHDKKYLGFEDGDAQGAMIDASALPLHGAVVIPEDGPETSAQAPFPGARGPSPCLPRSAAAWLHNPKDEPRGGTTDLLVR